MHCRNVIVELSLVEISSDQLQVVFADEIFGGSFRPVQCRVVRNVGRVEINFSFGLLEEQEDVTMQAGSLRWS